MAQGRFRLRSNVGFTTRDGVRLSTDLYLPPGDGPFATVLMRTPYDNTPRVDAHEGGALRGPGLRRRHPGLPGPVRLGRDLRAVPKRGPRRRRCAGLAPRATVVQRPDRDGRALVLGLDAWTAATEAHGPGGAGPDAIVPRVMATDLYRGLMWRGGAFNIGVLLTWGLMTSGRALQTLRGDRLGRCLPATAARGRRGRGGPGHPLLARLARASDARSATGTASTKKRGWTPSRRRRS